LRKVAGFCRVIDAMSEWIGKGMSLLLIPMVLLLVFEVTMRYGFNSPTSFSHEASLFLFGITGMLAGAWVLRLDGHIRMDAVYGRLSPRIKALLDVVTAPLFFFLIIVLLFSSYDAACFSVAMREHTSSTWGPPYYPVKIVVPVSALLILLAGVVKFIRDLSCVCKWRLK